MPRATEAQRRRFRELHAAGTRPSAIAQAIGVAPSTIIRWIDEEEGGSRAGEAVSPADCIYALTGRQRRAMEEAGLI